MLGRNGWTEVYFDGKNTTFHSGINVGPLRSKKRYDDALEVLRRRKQKYRTAPRTWVSKGTEMWRKKLPYLRSRTVCARPSGKAGLDVPETDSCRILVRMSVASWMLTSER